MMSRNFISFGVLLTALLLSLPFRAQTVESHGLITDPGEGVHKYYARAGMEYYLSNGALVSQEQIGRVDMVEAADGTIYIKNIISSVPNNVWVKATKKGNTLIVKAGQPVSYDSNYNVTLSVYKGSTPEGVNTYVKEADDITFTFDGNTLKLDNTDKLHFIGIFYDDEEDTFTGYANYNTVLTLDEGYTPPSTDPVQLPEGADVQEWYFSSTTIADNGGEIVLMPYSKTADVAFVGDDIYLAAFDSNGSPWIKGTRNADNVYTFERFQYVGSYGTSDFFATGSDGYERTSEFQDFQMKYDEEAQTLTSLNYLVANIGDEYIRFMEAYTDIVISRDAPPAEDPVAQTGPDIDTLPYSNALATAEDFAEFGVLDANGDEQTWAWTDNQYIGNGTYYGFSNYVQGDDWLVSPAIMLEAGKQYHFAVDARGLGTVGGRFEAKIAAGEARASVLSGEGITIIPATDATVDYATYNNNAFTVSETGYYHIGIHAISNQGYGYLFVANFLVEASADESVPAAADNFTVAPLKGRIGADVSFTAPVKNIGGNDLAADGIAKIELLRDGEVIAAFSAPAPGALLTYTDEAADLTIGNHKYQAVSYGDMGVGGKTEEIVVFLSGELTVPTSFDLTKEEVFNTFQTIDANNDVYGVWEWDPVTGTRYYGSENAADDYLVSLGIQLEAGRKYTVTVTARSHFSTVAERFEVKAGKEPTVAGLNITAVGATKVANDEFQDYKGEFTVAESGVYHLAIHAISAADLWRLYVSRLAIDGDDTGISTVTDAAKPFDVYSLDGRLVRRHATTLSGMKGIYIVNGRKVVL